MSPRTAARTYIVRRPRGIAIEHYTRPSLLQRIVRLLRGN